MLINTSHYIARSARYIHAIVGNLMTAFLLFIVINSFLITAISVDGMSMKPTLEDKELVPVDLLTYKFTSPQKGNIILFRFGNGKTATRLIKRVTGVPGQIMDTSYGSITLGEDEFFVVGDNTEHSTDSRVFGVINKDQIIGRVLQ